MVGDRDNILKSMANYHCKNQASYSVTENKGVYDCVLRKYENIWICIL